MASFAVLCFCALLLIASDGRYVSEVLKFDSKPVLSYVDGTSEFAQVFNPAWVSATSTQPKAGLIVRSQNCSGCGTGYNPSSSAPTGCCACAGAGSNASVLAFSELQGSDGLISTDIQFASLSAESVVFGPHDDTDILGTEDPRIAYDASNEMYYMMYTCWARNRTASLCLASTKDPTKKFTAGNASSWVRHGPVFPGDHKSGAMLIRDQPPHYLLSGAGQIHISSTHDLTKWSLGETLITTTAWGNPNVEAGPPPLKLSDGNYVFFYNSWGGKGVPPPGYQPAWAILDGKNPRNVLQQAHEPLWTPTDQPRMQGIAPSTCNVPQVAFLEAAHPIPERADTFRVYFGGADAVVGTVVVSFRNTAQLAQFI
eukprot:TRINITY_DN17833_c0_g1_i1.p1 TRINITY_DN17833_c0_g1~~TRINITY_DN17833_c0_g1_i1.p1  ORF type:complete len:370 (-),score=20.26 TRINITY_DN17833_c0_g1_i1:210-1319(-)